MAIGRLLPWSDIHYLTENANRSDLEDLAREFAHTGITLLEKGDGLLGVRYLNRARHISYNHTFKQDISRRIQAQVTRVVESRLARNRT